MTVPAASAGKIFSLSWCSLFTLNYDMLQSLGRLVCVSGPISQYSSSSCFSQHIMFSLLAVKPLSKNRFSSSRSHFCTRAPRRSCHPIHSDQKDSDKQLLSLHPFLCIRVQRLSFPLACYFVYCQLVPRTFHVPRPVVARFMPACAPNVTFIPARLDQHIFKIQNPFLRRNP